MVHVQSLIVALAGLTPVARGLSLSARQGGYTYGYGSAPPAASSGYGGGYGSDDGYGSTPSSGSAGSDSSANASSPPAAAPPATPQSSTADLAVGDVKCTSGMCIGAAVKGSNIEVVLQSTGTDPVGWMAMGFGDGMVNSPMIVMWKNPDGTMTLSQRKATGYSQPQFDAAPPRTATASPALSDLIGDKTKFAFTIPVDSDMKPKLIWAYGADTPSSSDPQTATWRQHTDMGRLSFDLTKSDEPASILSSPADLLTAPAQPGKTPAKVEVNRSEMIILAHAIVCAVAFLVVMPAGALLARYMRTFSDAWFKGHWILQFGLTGPLVLAGAILAGMIAPSGGPKVSNTHTQVGIVLFIMYGIQVSLGAVIHFVKPKNAVRRPIQNYIHAVIGISIIAVAFYQVHLGYTNEWPNAVGRAAPMLINILWYVWVVAIPLFYFGGLALLRRQFKQEAAKRAPPTPQWNINFQTRGSPSQDYKGYPYPNF